MPAPRAVSQEEVLGLRDMAMPLAYRPECEAGTSMGTFATAHEIEGARVTISSSYNKGQTNPGFSVFLKTPLELDGEYFQGQDYMFWRKGFPRPKYITSYTERIIVPKQYRVLFSMPYREHNIESRKQHNERLEEVDKLYEMTGFGRLDDEKYDFLVSSLANCTIDNRVAFGKEALHG